MKVIPQHDQYRAKRAQLGAIYGCPDLLFFLNHSDVFTTSKKGILGDIKYSFQATYPVRFSSDVSDFQRCALTSCLACVTSDMIGLVRATDVSNIPG